MLKNRCNPVKIIIFTMIFFISSMTTIYSDSDDSVARNIVKKVDEMYRSDSSYAMVEMEIMTPHWKRKLKINSWSMGKKKTFIRILDPKKERGMATLRIDKEMWNYFPKTSKVMKIPPSMMMGSWMGSDFTNDDLVKEYNYVDDYNFSILVPKERKKGYIYVKCIPKEGVPIVWGHIILAVKEKSYMPVWQKYYDEKGELMREMYFKEVKQMGKKVIPTVMELIPTKKKGKKTVIRYLKAEFDINIDKKIFSLRNLRAGI